MFVDKKKPLYIGSKDSPLSPLHKIRKRIFEYGCLGASGVSFLFLLVYMALDLKMEALYPELITLTIVFGGCALLSFKDFYFTAVIISQVVAILATAIASVAFEDLYLTPLYLIPVGTVVFIYIPEYRQITLLLSIPAIILSLVLTSYNLERMMQLETLTARNIQINRMLLGGLALILIGEVLSFVWFHRLSLAFSSKRERKLSENHKKYINFVRYSTEGIYYFHLEKPIPLTLSLVEQENWFLKYAYLSECNDAYAEMYGYKSRKECLGKRVEEFIREGDERYFRRLYRYFLRKYFNVVNEESKLAYEQEILYYENNILGIIENNYLIGVWGRRNNVTSKKKAEIAIRAKEEMFHNLYNSSPAGIIVVDIDERKRGVHCNDKACILFDATKDEVNHGNMLLFSPEYQSDGQLSATKLKEILHRYRSNRVEQSFEWLFQAKTGRQFFAKLTINPVLFHGERLTMLMVQDITPEKLAKQALIDSETRFRRIFETNSLGIQVTDMTAVVPLIDRMAEQRVEDPESYFYQYPEFVEARMQFVKIVNINQAMLEFTEAPSREYYVKNFLDFLTPSAFVTLVEEAVAIFNRAECFKGELEILTYTGKRKTLAYSVRYPQDGNYSNIVYTYVDITKQKKTEQSMRFKQLVIDSVVNNFPAIYYRFNREGDLVEIVGSGLERMNVNPKRLIGKNLFELYKDHPPIVESHMKALEGEVVAFQHNIIFKGRESFWDVKTFFDDETQTGIGLSFDITDKKRQEQLISHTLNELNEKNVALRKYIESNMQLENFAYIASHDLRAPIRTITSFSQLLARRAKDKLNEEELDFLNFIVTASKSMKALVSDLLAYSRVNTRKMNPQTLSFSEMLDALLAEMNSTIQESGAFICLKNIPEQIVADPTKIRQLFQNLISNAIKFQKPDTPPRIEIEGIEHPDNWTFFVRDNGIGIDPEFHERIFLLFRKLHSSDEYEGTGIGLALCKKIVEQHQGSINLHSEHGKGTTFYFSISKHLVPEPSLVA